MKFLKKIIPANARLQLRVFQKNLKDFSSGQRRVLVGKNADKIDWPSQLKLSQPIKSNNYSENKIHNLRLATSHIETLVIPSERILSFWKLIPKPVKKNGYKKGRNLIGDGLSIDYGGGLCQLSGILYHLSLIGGLKAFERHPHSKDIYTEETRYTPLGSDATVVYGHKDLRILNPLDQAISFKFEIKEQEIIAHLCAEHPVTPHELIFENYKKEYYNKAIVLRKIGKELELISEDKYERLK